MEQKINVATQMGILCLGLMMIPVIFLTIRAWTVWSEARIMKRKTRQK